MIEPEERPLPETFLQAVKKQEAAEKKGSLKIFLGLSAGVGKTYAMLKSAHRLQSQHVDVIIGIIDTHGKKATEALLKGFKIIPPKVHFYKNKSFEELDLDTIIALHPQVVLVDELAHHNVPGSKHTKRWQDVMDLLDSGIDVYTTLNVQHIESLNDQIRNITDVFVRETVPDHVIESASSIQIVDITPDELLQRLHEGKVYFDEQSKTASVNFFKKEKLTALREIALRYAADKVDWDLRGMAEKEKDLLEWKPKEKLLTAISKNSSSQRLIRTTKRLSAIMDAPWTAVFVNDGSRLTESESEQLARNFALARDLGAEVITVNDLNIVHGIKQIVKQKGITRIIAGRPSGSFFNIFKRYSFLVQLTRECRDSDIHIIREEKKNTRSKPLFSYKAKWQEYAFSLIYVLLLIGLSWLGQSFLNDKTLEILTFASLLILSFFVKIGPLALACLSLAILWGLSAPTQEDAAILITYILSALTIGILINREKEHKRILEKSEESTRTLYEMMHQMTKSATPEEMIKFMKERFDRLLHGTFEFVIKDNKNTLDLNNISLITHEKEKNTALWSFTNAKEAGRSTSTLPSSENLYIPIISYHDPMGIVIYRPEGNHILTTEEKNFIYTACQQLADFLERSNVQEKIYYAEGLSQMQQIQKLILNQVSKSLQWPVDQIKESLAELKKSPEISEIEDNLKIFSKNLAHIRTIAEFSEGILPLKKIPHSIEELIRDCVSDAQSLQQDHSVNIIIQKDLPKISFDYYLIYVLIHQLIVKSIASALPDAPIEIEAKRNEDVLQISLSSKGEILSKEDLEFTIAKTIAELHEGSLEEKAEFGNFSLTLSLPLT